MIIHQDLYPTYPIDAELSDCNHDGKDNPAGDDDGGQGAPSTEPTIPNLIGSGNRRSFGQQSAEQETSCACF
jgi:hypothetical protein